MAIKVPGKRYGKRLEHSKVFGHGHHGKKSVNSDLLITPLVDMFVIIVLFLIANFSASGDILNMSKDVQLPTAAHVKELEQVPVVMISLSRDTNRADVMVNGEPVLENALGNPDQSLDIAPLEDKLRELKKTFESMHQMAQDGQVFTGDVNIQSDKDIQFKLIKRVMFSCAAAGYGNINFAVLNGGTGKPANETASATP